MIDESLFGYYAIKVVMNVLVGSVVLWFATKLLKFKETGFEKALIVTIPFFVVWGFSGLTTAIFLSVYSFYVSLILSLIAGLGIIILIKLVYKENWDKTITSWVIFVIVTPLITTQYVSVPIG
jgi:hypothetical protein